MAKVKTTESRRATERPQRDPAEDALAGRIAAGRRRKGWTTAQLSADARVAPATVAAIEAGRRGSKRIRFDVLVRLARSLQESPIELLQIAGHPINARMREKVDRELDLLSREDAADLPVATSQKIDPLLYFQRLALRTRSSPGVMACCYTSPPAAAEAESVHLRASLSECLKNGLGLVMAVPYTVDKLTFKGEQRLLHMFYASVLIAVKSAARQLVQEAGSGVGSRVVVLRPRSAEGGVQPLVMPPLRLVEYRPALLCLREPNLPLHEHYELGVWMKTGIWARDEWVTINPAVGNVEAQGLAQLAVETWRGYFADVLAAWNWDNCEWDNGELAESDYWQIESF